MVSLAGSALPQTVISEFLGWMITRYHKFVADISPILSCPLVLVEYDHLW